MGVVARAHHLDLDQPVAIKLLLPGALENEAMVQRFRREARAMVQLKSEHVSKVLDVGTLETGAPYMVMEYLEGKDLGQWLREKGRLTPGFTVDLMLQACEALAEAHASGIVHRDIKPANCFLTRGPDGAPLLKVLDFGIAKALHAVNEDFTTSQALMGTPTYMSPEQMHSSKNVDPRTDIWALGVVLYELVSGRKPFRADSYAGLCLAVTSAPMRPLDDVDLPAGLAEIIARCLQKEPSQRFGDVAELAAALAPYAGTAAQASRSSERAARILALASAPAPALNPDVPEPREAPTLSQRKRRRTAGEPPGTDATQPTESGSSPSVTTLAIAITGATVDTGHPAAPAVELTARRLKRPVVVASFAIGAVFAVVSLIMRAQQPTGSGGPERQEVTTAPRPAAAPVTAPVPTGALDARGATASEPTSPPPDAGTAVATPSTAPAAPSTAPAAQPSAPAAQPSAPAAQPDARATRAPSQPAGSKASGSRRASPARQKDADVRKNARPDRPADQKSVYDDFE